MRKSISQLLTERRGLQSAQASTDESLDYLMQRAMSASEMGDKQTAHVLFHQIIQRYPTAVDAWVWLGWTSPNVEVAEAAFTQARTLDPTSEEAAMGLRWVASQRPASQPAQAAPAQTQYTQQAQQVQQMQQMQQMQREPQVEHRQHTALTESVASAPAPTPMSSSTSTYGYDLSPRQSAQPNVDEMMQQAINATRQGDKAGAHRIFERLASLRASDPEVWVWLGGTSPSLDDAERMFSRAYQLDPGNQKALLGLRWVTVRRQLVAAATPAGQLASVSDSSSESANSEDAPKKEGFLSRFFKRFSRPTTA